MSCDGLIYVVDSSMPERIEQVAEEFEMIAKYESLKNTPLLIFANKQDIQGAMTVDQIREELKVEQLCHDRKWFIQGSNAKDNEGLLEGIDWMSRNY